MRYISAAHVSDYKRRILFCFGTSFDKKRQLPKARRRTSIAATVIILSLLKAAFQDVAGTDFSTENEITVHFFVLKYILLLDINNIKNNTFIIYILNVYMINYLILVERKNC